MGVAVIGPEGAYESVNAAYCALYGYSEADMLGRSFSMVFPPAQRAHMLALHRAFLQGDGELNGEWEVCRQGGARISILAQSVRFPGAQGQPRRLVCVLDITHRKRGEQAAALSQRFTRSVLDGLSAHVCVLDARGVIVTVNQAWRDFAHANGGHLDRVCEGADYLAAAGEVDCHPGAAVAGGQGFGAQLREVLAGRLRHFQFEYPCHSPVVQRWFQARVARIAGTDPVQAVVSHENITEIKLAQEAVAQREALLMDMAASIPGALFRVRLQPGGERQFVYISPGVEALFEVSAAHICAGTTGLQAYILAEDRPAHEASIRAASASQTVWEHEYRICTARTCQTKWVHAKATPRADGQGGVLWTGLLTDVTERKRQQARLAVSEETFRTLFETVPLGVVYQDMDGRIRAANPAAQRILGLTLAQLQGRTSIDPGWQAVHQDGSPFPGEQHPAMVALATGRPVSNVVMGVHRPQQDLVWINVNAVPLFKAGVLAEVYASFEDITPRIVLEHELRQQATTDFLTGVANRRSFMARLEQEVQRVRRHAGLHGCVVSLDLDHFKCINDEHGHAMGDEVLKHVTRLMCEEVRRLDVVGRCGGEEFSLLLPDTATDEALVLAERLRLRVQNSPLVQPCAEGVLTVPVTVSLGITALLPDDACADEPLLRADRALYAAKRSGRNAVRVH